MKSYIPLETAVTVIFFLVNPFLKQGISSEYIMVDFICMGLLDLLGTQTENYKMKLPCPQWDSDPGPSAYKANALSVALLELITLDHVKVVALYLSFLCKLEWGCPNGTKYPPRQPIPNRAILPNRARLQTDGQGDSSISPLTSLRGV